MADRPKATWRIETYTGRNWRGQRFYFRGRSELNGEPLFPSEGYKSAEARDDTVKLIAEPAGARVIELG